MSFKSNVNSQIRGFWFAPSGSDSSGGGSLEVPKLTVQAAIDAASALDPPPSQGTNQATCTASQGGAFNAPIVCANAVNVDITGGSINVSAPVVVELASSMLFQTNSIVSLAAAGIAVNCNGVSVAASDTIFIGIFGAAGIGVKTEGTIEDLFILARLIAMGAAGAIGIQVLSTNTDILTIELGRASLDANNTTFLDYNPPNSTDICAINGSSVKKESAATGTTAFLVKSGHLSISITTIEADIAIQVDNGAECCMTASDVNGDIVVASGGVLHCEISHHTGTITNNGTIHGRINDQYFGDLDLTLDAPAANGGLSIGHAATKRLDIHYQSNGDPIDNVSQAQIITDLTGDLIFASKTNAASDLIFYTTDTTASIERLRIDSNGDASFTGDVDSRQFSNGTDAVSIGSGLTDSVRNYGRLGVNMDADIAQLSVKGSRTRLLTGSSSVTINNTSVSGTGTLYLTELTAGDTINFNGNIYLVQSITGDTAFILTSLAVSTEINAPILKEADLLYMENRAGVEELSVDYNGTVFIDKKLGIGIKAPTQDLHIYGSTSTPVRFKVENAGTSSTSQAGYELNQGGKGWIQYVIQSGGDALYFYSSTASKNIFKMQSSGEVDIPDGVLRITNNLNGPSNMIGGTNSSTNAAAEASIFLNLGTDSGTFNDRGTILQATATHTQLLDYEARYMSFYTGATAGAVSERLRIDSDGQVNSLGLHKSWNGQETVGQTSCTGNNLTLGFSQLGNNNVSIKVKKITGTTGSTQGDTTNIAHGLTGAKILSITTVVRDTTNTGVMPEWQGAVNYEYHHKFDATNVVITTKNGNSSSILSKAIAVMVTYEA